MPKTNPTRRPGRLRVIAGELRGRRLMVPSGSLVRPTADKVREALFDILGPRVVGSAFLDGYSGTGAVGIEALSRGAAQVVFIENQRSMVDLIARNLGMTGEKRSRARVIASDVGGAISLLEAEGLLFDIVYLDPPYAGGELDRAFRLFARSRLLRSGATLVVEHESRRSPSMPESLVLMRTVTYGRAALTLFERPHFR